MTNNNKLDQQLQLLQKLTAEVPFEQVISWIFRAETKKPLPRPWWKRFKR